MNEFALCIEYLLLNHDCVVVPGFGAFIAQFQEPRMDDEEEVMLPPYRLIRFNAELQQQDNFIVESIQHIYNISEQEAIGKLSKWVTDLQQTLEDNGTVDFGCVGVFMSDDDNTLTFTPSEAGITTPEFYGLDTFHIAPIVQSKKVSAPIIETSEKHVTIRISKSILNYAAAACIAIILFLSFSTPINNDSVTANEQNTAELFMPMHLILPSTQPAAKEATEVKAEVSTPETQEQTPEVAAENPVQNEVAPQPVQEEEIDNTPAPKYCIVMACAMSNRNAASFVQKLKKQGFEDARIHHKGKMVHVVVGEYETKCDAYDAAKVIHRQNEEYSQAWVLAL